jgi:hypothetical protein
MKALRSVECSPVKISWGQPYPRSEVFEPDYLDSNLVLVHLDIVDDQLTAHAPSLISSVVIQGLRRAASRVVTKEPHVRSIGI